MDEKLSNNYYRPQGYWKGIAAVIKLEAVAKFSENDAKNG